MQKPNWKLEAEAERRSLPGWYSIEECSRLCGYSGNAYLCRQANAGKFISYKVGPARLVPEQVAEILLMQSQKK